MHSHARRTVVTMLKIALAVAILSWLVLQARDGFGRLSTQTIEWRFLVAGLFFAIGMATLSFIRWHLLIRAQGLGHRLVDTLRLGALGFALNFVSPGSIGGDFFKAVFLAHGQPGKRTEAVATVIADRIVGVLMILGLASIGILVTGLLDAESAPLRLLCHAILAIAAVGWAGSLLILFGRGRLDAWLIERASSLRLGGRTIVRLLGAVQVYRTRKPTLLAALGVSLGMALCFITSFYMVARALPIERPSWAQHMVIVPVAGLVGAIPITPSGLGTTESAIEVLYQVMPGGGGSEAGDGTLVAVGRRVTDIAVALVGLGFYLTHRREVAEVFAEAEAVADME
jgi:uncharacterized protein (TIRG00374 family)